MRGKECGEYERVSEETFAARVKIPCLNHP